MDVAASLLAVFFDSLAVFSGFMLAVWMRLDSGLVPIRHEPPVRYWFLYSIGAAAATLAFLLVYRSLGLFSRPQTGSFVNKVPRLLKGTFVGIVLTVVLAFAVQNEVEFSRLVIAMAFFSISLFLLLERFVLYRIEWNASRHSRQTHSVLILGADSVAAHLRRTLKREPMLRSRVVGFLRAAEEPRDEDIQESEVKGHITDLAGFLDREPVDQIILTSVDLGTARIMDILLLCERRMIDFNLVPDLFRLLTASMDFQSLDDIPLLGVQSWPLDHFWNRVVKRIEDVVGSIVGLLIFAPALILAIIAIRADSRGPAFYHQERCGYKGRPFRLHKLRTMKEDAERETGPVFTSVNDTRRTRTGSFLRTHNLDELPQFWNVLRGEMSLVGPRPERPHFVEKFKTDISRYMWRHASKPGMTGWAQVNGLRGDTSIEERIRYDLYYLENWSLAFDFKILLKTIFARQNAY
jgi:exopolysaccharide biosynthesis polyprenyl glycosylphosphotransferase